MSPFMSPEWLRAQNDLKESMGKEINLMREMLSNLCQEETILLSQDRTAWASIMEDRSQMTERLKHFRLDRDSAVKVLSDFAPEESLDLTALQAILSEEQESCEMTMMLDQLIALTDKVNQQNIRNQALSSQVSQIGSRDASMHHYHPWGMPEIPIRKLALMTLQRKLSKEEV